MRLTATVRSRRSSWASQTTPKPPRAEPPHEPVAAEHERAALAAGAWRPWRSAVCTALAAFAVAAPCVLPSRAGVRALTANLHGSGDRPGRTGDTGRFRAATGSRRCPSSTRVTSPHECASGTPRRPRAAPAPPDARRRRGGRRPAHGAHPPAPSRSASALRRARPVVVGVKSCVDSRKENALQGLQPRRHRAHHRTPTSEVSQAVLRAAVRGGARRASDLAGAGQPAAARRRGRRQARRARFDVPGDMTRGPAQPRARR